MTSKTKRCEFCGEMTYANLVLTDGIAHTECCGVVPEPEPKPRIGGWLARINDKDLGGLPTFDRHNGAFAYDPR